MTDKGFWTSSQSESGQKQKILRPAVIEQMRRLQDSAKWLHPADLGGTQSVQKAVQDVINLVQKCFDFEPTLRPTAGKVNTELRHICDQLATRYTT